MSWIKKLFDAVKPQETEEEKAAREKEEEAYRLGRALIKRTMSQSSIAQASNEARFKNLLSESSEGSDKGNKGDKKGKEDKETGGQGSGNEKEGKGNADKSAKGERPSGALSGFQEKYKEDPQFRSTFNRLRVLFALMKISLRQDNGDLVSRLGFNAKILMKYLVAIFGSFDNPHLRDESGIRALLEEQEGLPPEDRRRKGLDSILFNDVLQLKNEVKPQVNNQCDKLTGLMKKLTQLWNLPDIERLIKVVVKIQAEEKSGKWISGKSLRSIADSEGGFINPVSQELSQDEALLDRMIIENNRLNPGQPSAQAGGGNPAPQQARQPQARQPQAAPRTQARVATPAQQTQARVVTPAQQPQATRPATRLIAPAVAQNARLIDYTELHNGIERLRVLLANFKSLDANECDDLRARINQTEIAQGNNLGDLFYTTDAEDPVQLLIDHFSPTNTAELEDLLLDVIEQFTERNII